MRRFTTGAAAAAITLAALGAGATGAQARTYASSTSFGYYTGSPHAFLGQVRSAHRACTAGRRVQVFRKLRGRRARRIGSDRATSTGQWVIEPRRVRRGRYYAIVPAARAGRHRCRAYRSSTIPVGD